jgi:hypothetical protein
MAIQAAGLRRLFPDGKTIMTRDSVSWFGQIAPSDYCRKYTVEMLYKHGDLPKVWVRQPDLKELAGEKSLPHVYDQKTQELCLYLPGCGFWTSGKSIASTVMLWACLWLYYFELWLTTGEWHGHGIHPESSITVSR